MFSPYYARALRRGAADPEQHCAVNIALYGAGGHHWAMTERGRRDLSRSTESFALGRTRLDWRDGRLTVDIDEVTTPFQTRLHGRVSLDARRGGGPAVALDANGLHGWQPIAPDCIADVALDGPGQHWRGHGYFDTNWGARPITQDFTGWDWSRSCGEEPRAFYELQRRDGSVTAFGAAYDDSGAFSVTQATAHQPVRRSLWRIARRVPGEAPMLAGTLEDTPFYARSLAHSVIDGAAATVIHERLDCDRLASGWVQALLPFRMPREG